MGNNILEIDPYSLNNSELKRMDIAIRKLQDFVDYESPQYRNKLIEIKECTSRRTDVAIAFGDGVLYAK